MLRFFLSPEGAAVFLPASFFSAGALPAGALPPVEGFFSAVLGGIFDESEIRREYSRGNWCRSVAVMDVDASNKFGGERDG